MKSKLIRRFSLYSYSVSVEVHNTESRLKHANVVGTVVEGEKG